MRCETGTKCQDLPSRGSRDRLTLVRLQFDIAVSQAHAQHSGEQQSM